MDSQQTSKVQVEQDTVGFWTDLACELGFPRSIGETYGILFISELPQSADDLAKRLEISRSGAGQAIKTLQDVGAVRRAPGIQSRKEHFEIQTDLSILVQNLLVYRFLPKINDLNRQRLSLANQVDKLEDSPLKQRFNKLERWCEKAQPVMEALKKFL